MKIFILILIVSFNSFATVDCIEDFIQRKDDLSKYLPYSLAFVAIPLLKTVKQIKIISGAEVLGAGKSIVEKAIELKNNGKDITYTGRFIGGSLGSTLRRLGKDISEVSNDLREVGLSVDDSQNIIEIGKSVLKMTIDLGKFSRRVIEVGDRLNLYEIKKLGHEGVKLSDIAQVSGGDIIFLGEQLDEYKDLKEFTDDVNSRHTKASVDYRTVGNIISQAGSNICNSQLVGKWRKYRFNRSQKLKFRIINKKELIKYVLTKI
jgi:hypothetical protein